jgi:hypothetical protein
MLARGAALPQPFQRALVRSRTQPEHLRAAVVEQRGALSCPTPSALQAPRLSPFQRGGFSLLVREVRLAARLNGAIVAFPNRGWELRTL